MTVLEQSREVFAKIMRERKSPPNADSRTPPEYELNELNEISLAPSDAPSDWGADRAAGVLAACNTLIDNTLAAASLTQPQRAVAEVLRDVVRVHAERHDPLLWDDCDFLAEQIAEWRKVNAGVARTPSPAPSKAPSFRSVSRDASWWAVGDEPDLLELVKELFPPAGAAPKVSDWRLTR